MSDKTEATRIENLLNEAEAEANKHYDHFRDLASGRMRGDHESEWDLFLQAEARVKELRESYYNNRSLAN